LLAGATHHMGAAQGRWTVPLLHLARMLGIEAVVV
jgi:L-arabinose isomerase